MGDDDQVIYGYSGATPEYLIHFDRYFPGAAHHPLEVNYRCPPAVVAAARTSWPTTGAGAKDHPGARGRRDPVPAAAGPLAGAGPVAVRTAPADALGRSGRRHPHRLAR